MPTSRRRFLQASTASWAAATLAQQSFAQQSFADDRPAVTAPRATDGDSRFEPDWEERLTLTVGPQGANLNGRDDRVIQAAVDYMARLGGGTVKILPGEYLLRAAVHVPSNIRLLGSGPDAVLTRGPSETIPLAADSDWYDQEITLAQPGDFRIGDSVALQAKNPSNQALIVIKRRIVAKSGNRLKLDDGLRENVWLAGQPLCSSLFPLLSSEHTADVTIENLTLDGNGQQTENFNGNFGGCIFLQDCNRYTLRGVETRNYNGDGISFQICHDVVVEDCYSHGNSDLGIHLGSGSQRPLIRGNRLERNGLGLFWCWGVKYGLAEGNRIVDNRNYGISIGHNDTDNIMRDNDIIGSGKVGILFRDDDRGHDFWANRNLVENNRIVNSGGPTGIAIDIQGKTKDVTVHGNEIRESRGSMERVGIRIAADAQRITLSDNRMEGLATDLVDLRS